MVGHGMYGLEWGRMEASPLLSNLATETEGFHGGGGQRGKKSGTLAVWSGYLDVLCCKLVRVRMHHGPMGRSMD